MGLRVIAVVGITMVAFADTAAARTPGVSASGGSVTEGDEIVFEVSLSPPSDRTVTVQYATENGVDRVHHNTIAQSGRDFTAASGTLSFAPGETRKTVRVSTTSDSVYERNEKFRLRLSNPTNAHLEYYSWARGTIIDDDPPPTVSVSDASATEGDKIEFKVSLSAPTERSVYVNLKPEVGPGDTATLFDFDDSEWELGMGGDGRAPRPLTVRVITADDDIDEEDETFTVRLSNPRGATLGDATATGTIIDDDDATTTGVIIDGKETRPWPGELPTVGFWSDPNVAAGGRMRFDVTLSKPSDQKVSVQYRTSSGTAQSETDFTPAAGLLVFQPGAMFKEVYVRTTRRVRLDEGNETFTLTLSNPTNATLGDATATGTITEADTDVDGSPFVAVKASTDAVEGQPVTFTVRLSAPSEQTVTVRYQPREIPCLGGCASATSGVDYVAMSGTLTFAPHQTEKTVSVPTTDDGEHEVTEYLYLKLSNPTNAVLRTRRSSIDERRVDARILDNDAPPVASFALQASSAQEDSGTHDVTINLSPAPTYPITLYYWVDFEISTATRLSDYSPGPGKVSVPSGATTATIPVTIRDDDVDDSGETIVLILTTPRRYSVGYTVGESSTHTVTIQDHVTPATPEVSISAGAGVTEGASATFTLTASPAPAAALPVDVTVTESGGYATAGTRRVTVPTGGTATFTVATVDDGTDEPDGSVTATLAAGSGYTVSSSRGTATVAVTDNDDPAPSPLTASFEEVPAGHDGTGFSFLVRLSEALGTDARAPAVGSFAVTQGRVKQVERVEAGLWRVRVAPRNWKRDVGVTLAGGRGCDAAGAVCAAGGRALANTSSATVPGPVKLRVAGGKAREGAGAAVDFAVTLSRAASGPVTVDYATKDGTATAGEDYTAASGTLAFAVGETEKTVAVAVLDDAHDEGKETFVLKLSNATGARIAGAKATGTIRNADPIPRAWLGRFGRAAASDAIAAATARFETPRAAGSHLTLGGHRLSLGGAGNTGAGLPTTPAPSGGPGGAGWPAWSEDSDADASRTMSTRELLMGTSFRAVLGQGAGAQLTSWGQGASVSHFSGGGPELSLSGEAATGALGMDVERGRLLAGFALTHSLGEGTAHGAGRSYALGSTVTTALPYARLALSERVSAWGLAGTGSGGLTLDDDGAAKRYRTDLSMVLAAAGARGELVRPEAAGGFALALKADAFWVRTESDAVSAPGVGNLAASRADASRLRAVLDGRRTFSLAGGATLAPSVELGLRHDGGDAGAGTGLELGAGLGFTDPSRGLDMALRVHGLAAQAGDGYSEWGVSGSLKYVPGAAGRGFSMSLVPSYGADPGGSERLWMMPDASALSAANDDAARSSRLDAEFGYGLPAFGGGFTGTPNVGFGLSDTARDYRLGWRLTSAVPGDAGFEVSLDATRREAADGDAPEHGVMLRSLVRW